MSTLFNVAYRLTALEQRLKLAQLRSMLADVDKELSTLQDIVAETKRLLVQAQDAAAQSRPQGEQGGSKPQQAACRHWNMGYYNDGPFCHDCNKKVEESY